MKPTAQQTAIIEAAKTLEPLSIQAYAGSGKSSTLRMIAQALGNKLGLYLTFNKALAEEAKETFPETVQCSTVHSLAYKAIRPRIIESQKDFINQSIADHVVDFPKLIQSNLCWCVLSTITKFCYSDAKEVTEDHTYNESVYSAVDDFEEVLGEDFDFRELIVGISKKVWSSARYNKMTHDMYLKFFELELKEGQVYCDYVCLDEAQDSNDVTLSIVRKIGKPYFIVGDSYQQIYSWRGSEDALEKVDGKRLHLSKSFRFGKQLADFASDLLSLTENRIEGEGDTTIESVLTAPKAVDAVVARSNKAVFEAAVAMYESGQPARMPHALALRNDFQKLVDFIEGRSPRYKGFTSASDLLDRVKQEPTAIDNAWMLVYSKNADYFIGMLEKLAHSKKGTVFTTAHKAKGLEWNNVYVNTQSWLEAKASNDESLRTLYVALTRAKKKLYINSRMEDVVFWGRMIG